MMSLTIPCFLVRYYVKEGRSPGPFTTKHAVFYDEDSMIKELPNIRGNYTIYEVGKEYKSKAYYDKIFADELAEKERQKYLELKQRYGE